MDRRQFTAKGIATLLALRTSALRGVHGLLAPPPRVLREGTEFKIEVPLEDPDFKWPRTLLSYPVQLDRPSDMMNQSLRCVETGRQVPFQLASNGADRVLLFFSDLPTNSRRTFRLVRGPSTQNGQARVKIERNAQTITIDLGSLQVRIPASQPVNGEAPGPILAVARNGVWRGQSTLSIQGKTVASITTEELEAGPLRSRHRITYAAEGAVRYIATVECTAGMDFVRLHEDMAGLPANVFGEFAFVWTGCSFDYRQAPNRPYNFPKRAAAHYAEYPWEAIAPAYVDTQFGVAPGVSADGKMPFSLRLFEPWQDVRAASFANFWSHRSSDVAAIFIDRMELWNDHQYSLWRDSDSRIAVDFYYRGSDLHFVWNLARGTRSTCVCFYDHTRDIEAMQRLEQAVAPSGVFPTSYALELQNWYGTLSLDKIKDWQLTYPANASLPRPLFRQAPFKNATEFDRTVTTSSFVTQLALSGTRQNEGFGPTSSRLVLANWVPGYQVFQQELTAERRRRVEAVLLLLAYVHAGEDYMPMEHMLSGHPNFLSDVKSTPPGIGFLFPEHPEYETWSEEWEAFLRLNTRYHTRPAVPAWGARAGRWTENLGTYVWAFLRPALHASFLLKQRDGRERLCGSQIAQIGDWLVNALSAPFAGESESTIKRIDEESSTNRGTKMHAWGVVRTGETRRVHAPMGAHSERRKPPRSMWYMGVALRNYSPLTSEHLMWAARPADQDMETPVDEIDPYAVMYTGLDNHGTNPHLRTAKYTGFGITLRSAVDTPQEVSVQLVQIDDGPNYRWGGAEGSCGIIYFFAGGKGWSYNGAEDAGDRIDQDTDFCSNFGVWKNGSFRAIGQNVLARPLYDLRFAQLAEITPRQGEFPYSWPEYQGRAVLLAGHDYFVVHDRVFNPQINHRFSWFVRKGDDFPHISMVSPVRQQYTFTAVETNATSGRWADGTGDGLAVITHKEGISAVAKPFGAQVSTPAGLDDVFLHSQAMEFSDGKIAFHGTSGIIRSRPDGMELAMFHGTYISGGGLSVATTDTDLGASAKLTTDGRAWGYFSASASSEVVLKMLSGTDSMRVYLDGEAVGEMRAGEVTIKLPAGLSRWELTKTLPVPLSPVVHFTEAMSGGAVVHGGASASATRYDLEISSDNAVSWSTAASGLTPVLKLAGLHNGTKYHVRLIAKNEHHASEAGAEYPLYVTSSAPPPPDGLQVALDVQAATLSWGEVLGITEYRLYRKLKNDAGFRIVYAGRATEWSDPDCAYAGPVVDPVSIRDISVPKCEYYVTAVSHNGESSPSCTANSSPDEWRNWNPTGNEPFRRTAEFTPRGSANDGLGRYYPQ